ncbi:TetR/AcrR family transcriptional regulator [Catelliglobosispora koreensis]|uniref:TetR/AcrR family transcriptional regulator n=1 Tax=Catelliglobosispora koreensis TaxID=129052 RepID=UPI000477216B|nr:TetR/AcrR family transcriptional regulator [Catelliglobosispora koreensis]
MAVKREGPTHRQRQAMATREQIASAARTLFAERGYAATTIAGISEAADIPVQTIYSALGSKAAILAEITRMWMAESQTPQLAADALSEPDPQERLRMTAHMQRRQYDVGNDVIAIYQDAARTDSQMAEVQRQVLASRDREVAKLIDSLVPHLAPGLTRDQAMDRFLTCTLVEIYRTLIHERGWTADDYEQWLTDLLISQLL